MGFARCGVLVVLVCFFALWGAGAALVIGKQSEKMTHVSTCEGLKRALGHEMPYEDVLVEKDITCSQEEWGEEPVIVYGEKMVLGVHMPPYDIPSVRFVGVVDGIVVSEEARLAIQKIRLNSEVAGQDARGNGTYPPQFVKVLQNGTLDFVGSQVCCQDCNIRVQEKIIDHKLIDGQAYVESSMPYSGPARPVSQVEKNPVIEQAPSSLCDSNPEYIKWAAGEFVGGGSYHLCSSTVSCKSDQSTNSAFVYYVDRTMQICQTSATVMILSHSETHAPRMSRTIEIVAIFVPSALCVVLMVLLAIFVRRSGSHEGGKYKTFSAGGRSMVYQTREISALHPCHRQTSIQEEFAGTEQAQSDEDSVVVSTTALSFGGVHVDLTRLLGQGGFSSVYKGTFQGNLAAIKIVEHNQCLKAECSGELAEVQLHRNLYHPYIVVTYCSKDVSIDILPLGYGDRNSPSMSIGFSRSCSPSNLLPARRRKSYPTSSAKGPGDNKCTLIVMEFCERGNLFEAIHQGEFFRQDMRGAPDFLVILRCALDVAVAMRYLHSKGIVHGDLKPENVLRKALDEDERGFICKVSDFGLSRMIPINTFLQTATLGTITHMPPELLRDGILAPSADIYSFGIMLWEMISGGFPFQGMSQHDIILTVVGGTRPPMPRFIPRDLWTLIQDCWHEDHLRRPSFATVVGVLQGALKEVLHRSPSCPSLSAAAVPEITFRRSAETPPDKSTESTPTPSTTPCASSESTTPLSGFEAWEPFGEVGLDVDRSHGTTSTVGLHSEQPRQAADQGLSVYDSLRGVNQVKYHRPIAQAPGTSYQDTTPALIWNSLKGQDGQPGLYQGNRVEPTSKWTEGPPGLPMVDQSPFVHAAVNPLSDLHGTGMRNNREESHMRHMISKNPSNSKGYWGPSA